MARIFICEPNEDVRKLFELFVARLGHDSVTCDATWDGELRDVDAVLLEPASAAAAAVLRAVGRAARPVPVICASIYPPPTQSAAASNYLLKPLSLADLARALDRALASPAASVPVVAACAT